MSNKTDFQSIVKLTCGEGNCFSAYDEYRIGFDVRPTKTKGIVELCNISFEDGVMIIRSNAGAGVLYDVGNNLITRNCDLGDDLFSNVVRRHFSNFPSVVV